MGGLKHPQAMKAIRGSRLFVSSMNADIFFDFERLLKDPNRRKHSLVMLFLGQLIFTIICSACCYFPTLNSCAVATTSDYL